MSKVLTGLRHVFSCYLNCVHMKHLKYLLKLLCT